MDTKLKNYRYSVWFKLLAIALCIAGMLTLAYGLLKAPYFEYAFQNRDFKESSSIKNLLIDPYYRVANIAFKYKNEEYIKSGEAIDKDLITNILIEKAAKLEEIERKYDQSIQKYVNGEIDTSSLANNSNSAQSNNTNESTSNTTTQSEIDYIQDRINDLKLQKSNEIEQINKQYDDLINNKKNFINEQLSDYRIQLEMLRELNGIYYTVVEGGKIVQSNIIGNSSTEDFYKELPYSTQITQNNEHSFLRNNYMYYGTSYITVPPQTIVYLGMSQERYTAELLTFNQNLNKGLSGLKVSSIGLLCFLFGLIYIIYVSGRRVDKDGVHLIAMDNVYLDISLVVSLCAIILCLAPIFEYGEYLFTGKTYLNTNLLTMIIGALISIGTLVGINLVSMFTKRLKRHEVIKHTLIFKVCRWIIRKIQSIFAYIYKKINSVFDTSPLAMRLVLISGAYAFGILISMLLFFAGPVGVLMGLVGLVGINVVAIYFILRTFKNFKDINDGAERIRGGELSYNIPEQGIPELKQLAVTINSIADGLKNAVSSQVKAERMKAELITNVSHDLKTPLTSIITYVDLLKNEGLQSENADKYLGVIDSKSQRLKTLTEDLFEAAKANSGSIPVNIEKLNIVSLINQGMGELSDKIEASGLSFKTNLPSEKVFVNADGKLLWRVIENVLSNVFKYALPHSRVYIDAVEQGDNIRILVKNISAYELNINADELMERFKRGDASRHSEGSGLGLSIAKSLAELQGGNFHIEVDGDLFKSVIELPICKDIKN